MDIRKIKKLIELIEETGINEIEIREGEESVRINRGTTIVQQAIPNATLAVPQAPVEAAPATAAAPAEETTPPELQGHIVKSPLVGTMYTAPTPGSTPFVDVGQSIAKGDVLCIIEAMKMMNQIEADVAGVVKARLVDNSAPVDFGQPLFIIEEQ